MKITDFRDKLTEAFPEVPVRHTTGASEDECPVIIWNELGEYRVNGDNKATFRAPTVQVDYYTESEYDSLPDQMDTELVNMETVWALREPTTYDDDRQEWRTIWTCYLMDGGN